jgi:hypothetical protein
MARINLDLYLPPDLANIVMSYNGLDEWEQGKINLQKYRVIEKLERGINNYYSPALFYRGFFNSIKILKMLKEVVNLAVKVRYTKNKKNFKNRILTAKYFIKSIKCIMKGKESNYSIERKKIKIAEQLIYFVINKNDSCEALTLNKQRCKNAGKTTMGLYKFCPYHYKRHKRKSNKIDNCFKYYNKMNKIQSLELHEKYILDVGYCYRFNNNF